MKKLTQGTKAFESNTGFRWSKDNRLFMIKY